MSKNEHEVTYEISSLHDGSNKCNVDKLNNIKHGGISRIGTDTGDNSKHHRNHGASGSRSNLSSDK